MNRKLSFGIMVFVMASVIAGCQSKPATRTFKASYDDTWNAALVAVRTVTGKDANSADKDTGKIVTAWNTGTLADQRDDPLTTRKSIEAWRGIVNVEKDIAGTKVVVRMQKGNYTQEKSVAENAAPDSSLNIVLLSTDKDPQVSYLNAVSDELVRIKFERKRKKK